MGLLFDSYYLDILSLIVALLCTVIAFFKYSFTYWSRKGVPYIPPQIPFGNMKGVISLEETVQDLYKQFKSEGHCFGGLYVFSNPYLLLVDPELIKNVMTKDFSFFSERQMMYNDGKEPITGHLLALSGTKWKNMRQTLTPTFTSGKMKMMFQTLISSADGLEGIIDDYVKNKKDIDIKDVVGNFTTDIIGSCAFGLNCNSLNDPEDEFRQYGRKLIIHSSLSIFKLLIAQVYPKLFKFLNLRLEDKDNTDFFMKVVADTVDYREKNNIKRKDFLQLLINIKNTGNVDASNSNENASESVNGQALTLGEIAAQCFLFFIAGFETSATVTSSFLYDMALHPDIQDKVRKEINDMLKKYAGKLTYEGILELQYLDKAINETMRMHSPIPTIQRRCNKDYKIPDSDVIIESGTTVVISVYSLQLDPEYYPEPTKYDPERFSNEEKAKRHPFTFLPFGEGPRICIAPKFGLLQIKVGLVALLKNHRFTLSKKTQDPIVMDPKSPIVFSVVGGIWLNAERI